MAHINKWIYSWDRYVDTKKVNNWVYTNTYNNHLAYKRLRKISNKLPYPVKWVECRKLNPEYKGEIVTDKGFSEAIMKQADERVKHRQSQRIKEDL